MDRSSVSHMENGRPPRGPVKRLLDMLLAAAENDTVDLLFPSPEANTELSVQTMTSEVRA